MKKVFYLSVIMLCAYFMVSCSDDENEENKSDEIANVVADNKLTTFDEGRVWLFANRNSWNKLGIEIESKRYKVNGTSEANGQKYYNIYCGSSKVCMMRENDGKIYSYDETTNKESLSFDCNMNVGDKSPHGYVLSKIEKHTGCDGVERRYFVLTEQGNVIVEYIEGIGYTDECMFVGNENVVAGSMILVCCQGTTDKYLYMAE